jgi:hypothetical protein
LLLAEQPATRPANKIVIRKYRTCFIINSNPNVKTKLDGTSQANVAHYPLPGQQDYPQPKVFWLAQSL